MDPPNSMNLLNYKEKLYRFVELILKENIDNFFPNELEMIIVISLQKDFLYCFFKQSWFSYNVRRLSNQWGRGWGLLFL